jgi:NAD(P)-dependent dehydrogenase (short-subunit alcohol dehydrogenase family)
MRRSPGIAQVIVAAIRSSAGILGPVANAWEHRTEDFRRVADVNLTGAFICCRVVVPLLLANPSDRTSGRRGSIVNASSIQAKKSPRRWRGFAPTIARSRRVRCSVLPAAVLLTDHAPAPDPEDVLARGP